MPGYIPLLAAVVAAATPLPTQTTAWSSNPQVFRQQSCQLAAELEATYKAQEAKGIKVPEDRKVIVQHLRAKHRCIP